MSGLEAGRELDRMIAETVMGLEHREWVPYGAPEGWYGKHAPRLNQRNERDEAIDDPTYISGLPYYRTDIADAWEVFCKFTSRYIWHDDATDVWHCHLDAKRRLMEDCRHHASSEESAMDAICRAALKAVNGA